MTFGQMLPGMLRVLLYEPRYLYKIKFVPEEMSPDAVE